MILGFDLETAGIVEGDGSYAIGITCAALASGVATITYQPQYDRVLFRYGDRMSRGDADRMAWALYQRVLDGDQLVTHNGAGFDWRVLWHEVSHSTRAIVKTIAFHSIDTGLLSFKQLGYMVGLGGLSRGLNLDGKVAGMDGLKAVELWPTTYSAQQDILHYVSVDAEQTLAVYERLMQQGTTRWVTRKGTLSKAAFTPYTYEGVMLSTYEALTLPDAPVPSWDNPLRSEDLYGWLLADDGLELYRQFIDRGK